MWHATVAQHVALDRRFVAGFGQPEIADAAQEGHVCVRVDRPRGMDITVVTTATNDDEGRALLKALGFPFKEN